MSGIPEGTYMIINTTSNLALSMRDTFVTLEKRHDSATCQKWHFTPGAPNEYSIKNKDTKNYLGVQGRIEEGALVEGTSAPMQWYPPYIQTTSDYLLYPAGIGYILKAPEAPHPGVPVNLHSGDFPLSHWLIKNPDDD